VKKNLIHYRLALCINQKCLNLIIRSFQKITRSLPLIWKEGKNQKQFVTKFVTVRQIESTEICFRRAFQQKDGIIFEAILSSQSPEDAKIGKEIHSVLHLNQALRKNSEFCQQYQCASWSKKMRTWKRRDKIAQKFQEAQGQ